MSGYLEYIRVKQVLSEGDTEVHCHATKQTRRHKGREALGATSDGTDSSR